MVISNKVLSTAPQSQERFTIRNGSLHSDVPGTHAVPVTGEDAYKLETAVRFLAHQEEDQGEFRFLDKASQAEAKNYIELMSKIDDKQSKDFLEAYRKLANLREENTRRALEAMVEPEDPAVN